MLKLLTIFSALLIPKFSYAQSIPVDQKLTNLEHFVRCYSKLTLQAPPLNDARYLAVKNGTLNPVTACMDLLKKATMTGTAASLQVPDSILNSADGDTVSEIVRNFNNFHRSWFPQKFYDGSSFDTAAALIRDYEEPSLYLTRALFGQVGSTKIQYNSVTTYSKGLMGLRERQVQPADPMWEARSFFNYPTRTAQGELTNISYNYLNIPAGTVNNPSSAQHTVSFAVPDNQLVSFGDLYGIKDAAPLVIPKVRAALAANGANRGDDAATVDIDNVEVLNHMMTTNFQSRNLREHFGGGIIGSQAFFLANSNLGSYQPAYRERVINRRFTSRIQEILMCHTLPNLLSADVSSEVNLRSEYTFQQSTTCMQCHSAIDPLAGTFRNLISIQTANINISRDQIKNGLPAFGVARFPANSGALDYVFSSPTGRLYYRDFNNKLISQSVGSPAALGTAISNSFDYYACASKRYYYFLTGIDVALNAAQGESSLSTYHRKQVFNYANRLKSHQNLMTLIQDIISSDAFKTRNYKSEMEGE